MPRRHHDSKKAGVAEEGGGIEMSTALIYYGRPRLHMRARKWPRKAAS